MIMNGDRVDAMDSSRDDLITRKQLTRYEREKIISESIYKKVVDDEGEQIGGVADDDAGSGGTR